MFHFYFFCLNYEKKKQTNKRMGQEVNAFPVPKNSSWPSQSTKDRPKKIWITIGIAHYSDYENFHRPISYRSLVRTCSQSLLPCWTPVILFQRFKFLLINCYYARCSLLIFFQSSCIRKKCTWSEITNYHTVQLSSLIPNSIQNSKLNPQR